MDQEQLRIARESISKGFLLLLEAQDLIDTGINQLSSHQIFYSWLAYQDPSFILQLEQNSKTMLDYVRKAKENA